MGPNFKNFEMYTQAETSVQFLGPGVGRVGDKAKFMSIDDPCNLPIPAPSGEAVLLEGKPMKFYFRQEGLFKLCFMFAEEVPMDLWREYREFSAFVEPCEYPHYIAPFFLLRCHQK